MNQEKLFRAEMRATPSGRLLVRYGFEPYDTESSARRVAECAVEDIIKLRAALKAAGEHLDYCGYGDAWERECSQGLSVTIAKALQDTEAFAT